MSLMRIWLRSIQEHIDDAVSKGLVSNVTGAIISGNGLTDEARIARRMLCSYGNVYNCTGRVSYFIKLQ